MKEKKGINNTEFSDDTWFAILFRNFFQRFSFTTIYKSELPGRKNFSII